MPVGPYEYVNGTEVLTKGTCASVYLVLHRILRSHATGSCLLESLNRLLGRARPAANRKAFGCSVKNWLAKLSGMWVVF